MPLTRDLSQSEHIRGSLDGRVPVFDATALDAAVLGEACAAPGFFCVDGAFDGDPHVHAAWQQMSTFFRLADDDPRKQAVNVERIGGRYGWTPQGGEPAYQPGTRSHLESFDFGRPGAADANAWPELPGFRKDMLGLWHAMSALGDTVLAALSVAAGLPGDALKSRCSSRELSTLRLLHYAPEPRSADRTADRDVGIAAHTDFECMTFILQTAPGLELRDADGAWYDAPSDRGRVTVLLGDMLERFTNGKFPATGHRVRRTPQRRFSIVKFFAVNDDEIVEPLSEGIGPDEAPHYPPVRQRDHLAQEVSRAIANRDEFTIRREKR